VWCSFGQLAQQSCQVVGEGVVRALTLEPPVLSGPCLSASENNISFRSTGVIIVLSSSPSTVLGRMPQISVFCPDDPFYCELRRQSQSSREPSMACETLACSSKRQRPSHGRVRGMAAGSTEDPGERCGRRHGMHDGLTRWDKSLPTIVSA
jgi:hypothetical protein